MSKKSEKLEKECFEKLTQMFKNHKFELIGGDDAYRPDIVCDDHIGIDVKMADSQLSLLSFDNTDGLSKLKYNTASKTPETKLKKKIIELANQCDLYRVPYKKPRKDGKTYTTQFAATNINEWNQLCLEARKLIKGKYEQKGIQLVIIQEKSSSKTYAIKPDEILKYCDVEFTIRLRTEGTKDIIQMKIYAGKLIIQNQYPECVFFKDEHLFVEIKEPVPKGNAGKLNLDEQHDIFLSNSRLPKNQYRVKLSPTKEGWPTLMMTLKLKKNCGSGLDDSEIENILSGNINEL